MMIARTGARVPGHHASGRTCHRGERRALFGCDFEALGVLFYVVLKDSPASGREEVRTMDALKMVDALRMDVFRDVAGLGGARVVWDDGALLDGEHGPGARDQWLELFGQGRWADIAPGSGWLALQVSSVSQPEVLTQATDDEILGIGRSWKALETWAFARKLTVVRELIRRHPLDERWEPDGLPSEWEPALHHEVAAALGISTVAAGKLVHLAWTLDARLRGVGQALEHGRLDPAQGAADHRWHERPGR